MKKIARPTNAELRNKRKRTLILSKEADLVLENIKKNDSGFNFSYWASKKLLESFKGRIDKEKLIRDELIYLQNKRDAICDEYDERILILANRLSQIKNENKD